MLTPYIWPEDVSNFREIEFFCFSFSIVIQFYFNYDIKNLIMMQKLKPRIVGLKLTKIGHVDKVKDYYNCAFYYRQYLVKYIWYLIALLRMTSYWSLTSLLLPLNPRCRHGDKIPH